ncbi:hypothetical protein [Tichowtungia aerotolerans]|uniref:Uncharacterized protein n=1 Tax=Tichowtungia aerotolerans TaxID=2697043 RepID=A0A6P1M1S5_9BACT|nr:hypothetical protein [Tichowtungia aerotolerans]QHI68769.1 hypothetical protein GT409_04665 [Tichowtungia aerotolerans]
MATYFFSASDSAHKQITGLFDFVWPTATAMWNLRWQVAGYLDAIPNATNTQLKGRFSEGANIHGANLRRACIEHSWEEQKESFSRLILTNIIAIYEGWVDAVLSELNASSKERSLGLQFPRRGAGKKDVTTVLRELTQQESIVLKTNFYSSLCGKLSYSDSKLEEMLLCYRFFKEIRNCEMHSTGVCTQRLIDAYTRFSAVASATTLGVKEVPKHSSPILGAPVEIDLHGVVGLSGIVLKMIATLDAELSRSQKAEIAFCKKWRTTHPHRKMLSAKEQRRKFQIVWMVKNAHFPKPSNTDSLGEFLKQNRLIQL